MDRKPFPEKLDSERIYLRKHSLSLARSMYQYIDRDRARLRQFLPWVDSTRTIQDEICYIEATFASWDNFTLFDYGMFRKEGDLYMGNIGVHNIAWAHDRCELGYWILGDFEGKGYVSEAVKVLGKAAFSLGFNRIEICCSSQNRRSASIPVRCGYQLEGTLRQDVFENGEYRDTLVFGKLKQDSP